MDFVSFANSAIIGVDSDHAKQQVFLCNPYLMHCIFDSMPRLPAKIALLTQWFVSLWTVSLQLWVFYFAIVQEMNLSFDTTSPFVHLTNNLGLGLFFWVILTIWQVVLNSLVMFFGLLTDIFQGPDFLRKVTTIFISLNSLSFIFGQELLVIIIAYFIFTNANYSFTNSALTLGFYKVGFSTFALGGLQLTLLNSIRIWYWDKYRYVQTDQNGNQQIVYDDSASAQGENNIASGSTTTGGTSQNGGSSTTGGTTSNGGSSTTGGTSSNGGSSATGGSGTSGTSGGGSSSGSTTGSGGSGSCTSCGVSFWSASELDADF